VAFYLKIVLCRCEFVKEEGIRFKIFQMSQGKSVLGLLAGKEGTFGRKEELNKKWLIERRNGRRGGGSEVDEKGMFESLAFVERWGGAGFEEGDRKQKGPLLMQAPIFLISGCHHLTFVTRGGVLILERFGLVYPVFTIFMVGRNPE